MPINAQLMANGSYDVSLKPETPRTLLNGLSWLSTVVFTDTRVDEELLRADYVLHPDDGVFPSEALYLPDNTLFQVARFAGVLIGLSARRIRGYGMAWWLGDSETGEPYESTMLFGGVPLSGVIPHLLPSSVLPGTIHDSEDVFTGSVGQYQLPRPAIEYVSTVMRSEWRVNPDGTFDAGSEAQLFTDAGDLLHPGEDVYPGDIGSGTFGSGTFGSGTFGSPVGSGNPLYPLAIVPAAIVVADKWAGVDVDLVTLQAASLENEADVEGYANRVLVVGEDLVSASAELDSPYRDPHGNPVRITKLVSDPDVDTGNAAQKAIVEVSRRTETRTAVTLSVNDYTLTDPAGQAPAPADVGTTIWVYDPDEGLFDTANPVPWRGQTVYPVALRVLGASWPITKDTGVYVGNLDGTWTDLTPYTQPETGAATLEVGATRRTLLNLSKQREAFRTRVAVT